MAKWYKSVHMKKLFWDNLKPSNTEISCNVQKSAKNSTGIFEYFHATAYLSVFTQQTLKKWSKFMEKIDAFMAGKKSVIHVWVAEPGKVLVGELNEWVANGQTSALQIKTRTA